MQACSDGTMKLQEGIICHLHTLCRIEYSITAAASLLGLLSQEEQVSSLCCKLWYCVGPFTPGATLVRVSRLDNAGHVFPRHTRHNRCQRCGLCGLHDQHHHPLPCKARITSQVVQTCQVRAGYCLTKFYLCRRRSNHWKQVQQLVVTSAALHSHKSIQGLSSSACAASMAGCCMKFTLSNACTCRLRPILAVMDVIMIRTLYDGRYADW